MDNDKAVFEQIMQRFRPIIPKPTTGGESGSAVKGGEKSSTKKRKYVRASKCKKRNRGDRDSIFTLQLLPADQLPIGRKDSQTPKGGRMSCNDDGGGGGMKMNSNSNIMNKGFTLLRGSLLLDRTVETWVTVERVTGNCMDGRGLGCTDDEMIMNLERDTCPGFISDGENKVTWVNMAYRKMVWEEEERGAATPPQVVVSLVAMADLAESLGFACRVRVQYYNYYYYYYDMSNCLEKQCRQIVVPCDVWRMEFGGLAWRLDVQAALSLGRR